MAATQELFAGIEPEAVQAARAAARAVEVPAGTQLIAQYDTTDAMFVLDVGRVSVHAEGAVVATLEAGAVLGEIGLFTAAVRTASVVAAEPCKLIRIDRAAFETLREAENPVAFRMERRALQQLSGRIRGQIQSLQAVAAAAPDSLVPVEMEPSSGQIAPLPPAALVALLGTAASFSIDDKRYLRRICRSSLLAVIRHGEIVTDPEGAQNGLHVLLDGRIDGLARVPGRSMLEGMSTALSVDVGDVFNICPTVDGEGRSLWYVARQDSSLLHLDADIVQELYQADTQAGSVLRQAMIRSLFEQLTEATRALHTAHEAAVRAAESAGRPQPKPIVRARSAEAFVDDWFGGETP